jgi:hypothetical protein
VKIYIQILIQLLIPCLVLLSCKSNRFETEINDVQLNLDFSNLNEILINASQKELVNLRQQFREKKSDILDYNIGYCYRINMNNDTAYFNGVKRFFSNKYTKKLEETISSENNLNANSKKQIEDAFKRLKVHFSNGKLPRNIYQINSFFSSSVFCTEKEIAIGIERYLGPDNKLVKELPNQEFYSWIKESMNEEFIERDVIAAWLMTNYVEETSENFASEVIRWGKILFITKVCLPKVDERIILRYNQKQFEWAENSEKSIWKFLVEKEILFKIDEETRMNFLKEGPYTIGMPEESPDRIGQYIGYKIVTNFMDQNEISLQKLISTPYNEILQKYKLD